MQHRSWLLVSGDDDERLASAVSTGADVIVVDLSQITGSARLRAWQTTVEWLHIHRHQITGNRFERWVRVTPFGVPGWREDLAAAIQGAPEGILLPRSEGPDTMQQVAAELYELESANQIPTGSTKIIPLVGGTPLAAMTISGYIGASLPRLGGLAWTPDELAEAIGATRANDHTGNWSDAFRFLRAQALLTAHARGLFAIDAPYPDPDDLEGLRVIAEEARADGFTGMLAIDPAQVRIINEAFWGTSAAGHGDAPRVPQPYDPAGNDGDFVEDRWASEQPRRGSGRWQTGMEEGPLEPEADLSPPAPPPGPILRPA